MKHLDLSINKWKYLLHFARFNSAQADWSERSNQIVLGQSIWHSLVAKNSYEINKKNLTFLPFILYGQITIYRVVMLNSIYFPFPNKYVFE